MLLRRTHQKLAVTVVATVLLVVFVSIGWQQDKTIWRVSPVTWEAQLCFSKDDKLLAIMCVVGDKSHIVIIDVRREQQIDEFECNYPTAFCFSPDNDSLAIIDFRDPKSEQPNVVIRDLTKRRDRKILDLPNGDCATAIGFSEDGLTLVSGTSRKFFSSVPDRFHAWDLKSGLPVEYRKQKCRWSGAGLSPDGSRYVIDPFQMQLMVYDTESNEQISICERAPSFFAVEFTRDSQEIVTVHEDGSLVIWKIDETGAKQVHIQFGFDNCFAIQMSKDGSRVAYVDDDGAVRLKRLLR